MKRMMMLSSAVLLMYACATEHRMTPTERLEMYRAHAGEPVTGFRLSGSVWGWRALGNSALTVWPRNNEGFLIELVAPCMDLPSATRIELTNRTNRVTTFDSVIPRRHTLNQPMSRPGCRIRSIRPINTQAVVEVKRDMGEVDVTERDPSEPNDPEQGDTQ